MTSSWAWELFVLEEGRPGRCPCCDEPLPPTGGPRARVLCGEPECLTLFNAIYRQGLRTPCPPESERQLREAGRWPEPLERQEGGAAA